MFQLEHDQDMQQWAELIARLGEWLQAPEHTSLRRAFTVWVRRVVLPNRLPGVDPTEISALQDLHEVHDMLAERIKAWPEKWRREGLEEGREEAREENARTMIMETSMDDTMIAKLSGLDVARVAELRQRPQPQLACRAHCEAPLLKIIGW